MSEAVRETRVLWWACGIDPVLLDDPNCPSSERQRYSALGGIILLGVAAGFLSAYLAAGYVFFVESPTTTLNFLLRQFAGLALGTFWAVFLLNLLRLTVGLAGRQSDRFRLAAPDVVRAMGIVGVTAALAVATAAPLQVLITERDGAARALAIDQYERLLKARATDAATVESLAAQLASVTRDTPYTNVLPPLPTDCRDLVDCQSRYAELALLGTANSVSSSPRNDEERIAVSMATVSVRNMSERLTSLQVDGARSGFFQRASLAYLTNPQFCWAILLGVWVLFVFPPAVRLLTDRGAYDFLVQYRNRQWLAHSGIEPKAYTVFNREGKTHFIDVFHTAKSAGQQREREIAAGQRFEDELRRQKAAYAWASIKDTPAYDKYSVDSDPTQLPVQLVLARKRVVSVEVEFANEDTKIVTREGPVIARAGDAVITALTGERWPVSRDLFDAHYALIPSAAPGEPSVYHTRAIEVRALKLVVEAHIEATRGGATLAGAPGDWLVDYGDGSLGVIAQDIFENAYEILSSV